ncbi:MAG: prepilin-type N-terminal cleavage/methylation domain-containing protein [Undibacterium sp.]|uniref:type II secretion system protein n=1 Tax=Undibacterium sp. TaxID=1914977 RepID=UPI002717EE36|nr:prepilin-type N-terminal cleavage/methylation domain-containing protein [Undibacterium sp.]MDO8653450.1 prepilin-type N-terminal cleavage/methylation domain-containing protein [Undibacterium sp.]
MVNKFCTCSRSPRTKTESGFTLIELLVVLAIVALLLTLSMPRYFQSIGAAKETVLIENLKIFREAIDKFYGDKGRYPDSLEELVDKKYLRALPVDPVSEASWLILAPGNDEKGAVYDIKSTSPGNTREGKLFSEL